jgi:hypothetical protein
MVLEHLFDEGTALEALQLMGPGVHVEAQVSQLLRQKDLFVPRKLFMILKLNLNTRTPPNVARLKRCDEVYQAAGFLLGSGMLLFILDPVYKNSNRRGGVKNFCPTFFAVTNITKL